MDDDVHASLDPVWEDMDRSLGQLFMMGFEGTHVTSHVRKLIQEHHVGSILLAAKNLKSADETSKLVYDLQKTAFDAGHPVPLIIAIDQENGSANSLFDEEFISQYPSAMGIAATGSTGLAEEVSMATGKELAACGFNLTMGPCLDVLTNTQSQPLGVRALGNDPREVSSYSVASIKGYKHAGIATTGKHFPSHGSLEYLGSPLDVPTLTESLEQLSLTTLLPFRTAIDEGLDAVLVGACAMSSPSLNAMHACLSEQVVNGLLRQDLNFDGVVISDCLEIEALSHNIGIGGGTTMAVNAGCDLVLLCRSSARQKEAIEGLKLGLDNGVITKANIRRSLHRILRLKAKYTNWEQALNPPGVGLLSQLRPSHNTLSTQAYNSSITIVRDRDRNLPLTNSTGGEDDLLLLTPLVRPLVASAASQQLSEQASGLELGSDASAMSGEEVFRELGTALARQRRGRVMHASYTANGVRPQHESLIARARAVVIITADATRHLFQTAFAKHVSMLCNSSYNPEGEKADKPLIVVAVSSPYDFALDQTTIGTYVCTYDFTDSALTALVKVLYGEVTAVGALPGTLRQTQKVPQPRQYWLVEAFNEERDTRALDVLIASVCKAASEDPDSEPSVTSKSFLLGIPGVQESHFVVRNSSTQALYGFCSTYYFGETGAGTGTVTVTGVIGTVFVDPGRRKLSIGHSLHDRAIRSLLQRKNIKRLRLGSYPPFTFPGSPTASYASEHSDLRAWFARLGWGKGMATSHTTACCMVARDLSVWQPPSARIKSLRSAGIDFDLVHSWSYAGPILDHIAMSIDAREGLLEVYRLALTDSAACGVVRAKTADGELLGTIVLFSSQSKYAEFVPSGKALGPLVGGLSSPVVSSSVCGDGGASPTTTLLLQGLISLGLWKLKQQGCRNCILDYIDGESNIAALNEIGLSVLHGFEDVACDATIWNVTPPST